MKKKYKLEKKQSGYVKHSKRSNGNYKLKMGTLAKKHQKNIKNSAKNEKCVYWNDVFIL